MSADLFAAARDGNIGALSDALSTEDVDCNAVGENGLTLLISAILSGSEHTVKLLLECGADPNVPDATDRTPVAWATDLGKDEIVEMLLAAGGFFAADEGLDALPSSNGLEGTPEALTVAAAAGHVNVVQVLLSQGADVNEADEEDMTPLMHAARGGHAAVVTALIEAGAEVDAVDAEGNTALLYAVDEGSTNAVTVLLDAGADVDTVLSKLMLPEEDGSLHEDTTIVFVLGGPGSGKGTQCELMVKHYGFTHLSTGDLLRAEAASGSAIGKIFEAVIKNGKLTPFSVTITLLRNAMLRSGSNKFLVDGFPRSLEQAEGFETNIMPARLVLFFDCPEAVMAMRLMHRGQSSGRSDDNEETIRKRLATFVEVSLPVKDFYLTRGTCHVLSSAPAVDEVYEAVCDVLDRAGFEQLPSNPAPGIASESAVVYLEVDSDSKPADDAQSLATAHNPGAQQTDTASDTTPSHAANQKPDQPDQPDAAAQSTTAAVYAQPKRMKATTTNARKAYSTSCPHCNRDIVTVATRLPAPRALVFGAGICLVGGVLGCCFLPTALMEEMNDVHHSCPHCNKRVAISKGSDLEA